MGSRGCGVLRMTIDGLAKFHQARPFKAFVMRLTDGRQVRVEHPELLARSQSGLCVFVFTMGDEFELVDLLHVVSINPANGARKSRGGNGRTSKE